MVYHPRPGKTRKQKKHHRSKNIPPSPGPTVCSPVSEVASTRRKSKNHRSCLPNSVLEKVKKNPLCEETNERCLIEKSNLGYREKKKLLNTYFRPLMPKEWKKKPDMWLNSDDISNVMKQYEIAYKHFRFMGVVPIDFSAPSPYQTIPSVGSTATSTTTEKKCMNQQFCTVNLKEERAAGHTLLGAIFNLDPHYLSGSHWVGLAIDLKQNYVYYFDSYGLPPPQQIAHYMRYLTIQEPKLELQSNGRRFQYSNTECGMYSMYFLIRMIQGESFKKFCKTSISDKWMLKFRKVLFDPSAV